MGIYWVMFAVNCFSVFLFLFSISGAYSQDKLNIFSLHLRIQVSLHRAPFRRSKNCEILTVGTVIVWLEISGVLSKKYC